MDSKALMSEVGPGVAVLRCPFADGANAVAVVVLDAGELALVDAGVEESPAEVIEPALAARDHQVADVRVLAITHADRDHVGGVPAIRAASRAPLLAHPLSAERLGVNDARLVEDGERLELGGIGFVALHTPGHRRDMLSLYSPERRLLIASDCVQGRGTPTARFLLIGDSGRAYRASLERLRALDVDTLITGHAFWWPGERSMAHRGEAVRRYFEASAEAAREVEAVVEEVARSGRGETPDRLIVLAAERLAPRVGFGRDANGSFPAAVAATIGAELRDLGISA